MEWTRLQFTCAINRSAMRCYRTLQYHSGVPNLCTCVGRHEEDGVQDQTVA